MRRSLLAVIAFVLLAVPARADEAADVRGYYGLLAYERCNPGSFNPKLLDGIKTLIALSALSTDVRWIETQMMSFSCTAIQTLYTPEKVARLNSIYK